MDEVSAGVYEVVGRDAAGHVVSAKGTDLEAPHVTVSARGTQDINASTHANVAPHRAI